VHAYCHFCVSHYILCWVLVSSANQPAIRIRRNRTTDQLDRASFVLRTELRRGRRWPSACRVDGTLVEAWAGQKSFQAKKEAATDTLPPSQGGGSNPTVDFHKQKRSNQTHQSKTDPSARLFKKTRGAEAKLGFLGHVVTENRNGLVVDTRLTLASGTADRDAAIEMMAHKPVGRRVTLGGDRGYDTRGFVEGLRRLRVTPHVAENTTNRRRAIDGRTTQHEGYAVSQRKRKRVEEVFGWLKTVALQRKTRFRGPDRVGWMFTLAAAAYNLVRMRNLAQAV
jgi:hypothetical protein